MNVVQEAQRRLKMKIVTVLLVATLSGGMTVFCTGCERQEPAESAGKKIDRAIEDAKDKLDPPGPAESAGKKIDRAIEDATK